LLVVLGYICVQAAKPEFLKKVGLPQIAEVIVDPAGFGPTRNRRDVEGKNDEKDEAAEYLQISLHTAAPMLT
jgi:hypothetical protein